ncbi:MAG: hypothetical protein H7318_00700 [Oligoflexus sp.]|nr:hypothetical protein [Oligoflexus sp.]
MSKLLARLCSVLEREVLSVWIIVLSLGINILAWVVPRGSYQNPSHDPLGVASFLNSVLSDGLWLYYFWHAVIIGTVAVIAYSLFKIWTLGMTHIVDRCDL